MADDVVALGEVIKEFSASVLVLKDSIAAVPSGEKQSELLRSILNAIKHREGKDAGASPYEDMFGGMAESVGDASNDIARSVASFQDSLEKKMNSFGAGFKDLPKLEAVFKRLSASSIEKFGTPPPPDKRGPGELLSITDALSKLEFSVLKNIAGEADSLASMVDYADRLKLTTGQYKNTLIEVKRAQKEISKEIEFQRKRQEILISQEWSLTNAAFKLLETMKSMGPAADAIATRMQKAVVEINKMSGSIVGFLGLASASQMWSNVAQFQKNIKNTAVAMAGMGESSGAVSKQLRDIAKSAAQSSFGMVNHLEAAQASAKLYQTGIKDLGMQNKIIKSSAAAAHGLNVDFGALSSHIGDMVYDLKLSGDQASAMVKSVGDMSKYFGLSAEKIMVLQKMSATVLKNMKDMGMESAKMIKTITATNAAMDKNRASTALSQTLMEMSTKGGSEALDDIKKLGVLFPLISKEYNKANEGKANFVNDLMAGQINMDEMSKAASKSLDELMVRSRNIPVERQAIWLRNATGGMVNSMNDLIKLRKSYAEVTEQSVEGATKAIDEIDKRLASGDLSDKLKAKLLGKKDSLLKNIQGDIQNQAADVTNKLQGIVEGLQETGEIPATILSQTPDLDKQIDKMKKDLEKAMQKPGSITIEQKTNTENMIAELKKASTLLAQAKAGTLDEKGFKDLAKSLGGPLNKIESSNLSMQDDANKNAKELTMLSAKNFLDQKKSGVTLAQDDLLVSQLNCLEVISGHLSTIVKWGQIFMFMSATLGVVGKGISIAKSILGGGASMAAGAAEGAAGGAIGGIKGLFGRFFGKKTPPPLPPYPPPLPPRASPSMPHGGPGGPGGALDPKNVVGKSLPGLKSIATTMIKGAAVITLLIVGIMVMATAIVKLATGLNSFIPISKEEIVSAVDKMTTIMYGFLKIAVAAVGPGALFFAIGSILGKTWASIGPILETIGIGALAINALIIGVMAAATLVFYASNALLSSAFGSPEEANKIAKSINDVMMSYITILLAASGVVAYFAAVGAGLMFITGPTAGIGLGVVLAAIGIGAAAVSAMVPAVFGAASATFKACQSVVIDDAQMKKMQDVLGKVGEFLSVYYRAIAPLAKNVFLVTGVAMVNKIFKMMTGVDFKGAFTKGASIIKELVVSSSSFIKELFDVLTSQNFDIGADKVAQIESALKMFDMAFNVIKKVSVTGLIGGAAGAISVADDIWASINKHILSIGAFVSGAIPAVGPAVAYFAAKQSKKEIDPTAVSNLVKDKVGKGLSFINTLIPVIVSSISDLKAAFDKNAAPLDALSKDSENIEKRTNQLSAAIEQFGKVSKGLGNVVDPAKKFSSAFSDASSVQEMFETCSIKMETAVDIVFGFIAKLNLRFDEILSSNKDVSPSDIADKTKSIIDITRQFGTMTFSLSTLAQGLQSKEFTDIANADLSGLFSEAVSNKILDFIDDVFLFIQGISNTFDSSSLAAIDVQDKFSALTGAFSFIEKFPDNIKMVTSVSDSMSKVDLTADKTKIQDFTKKLQENICDPMIELISVLGKIGETSSKIDPEVLKKAFEKIGQITGQTASVQPIKLPAVAPQPTSAVQAPVVAPQPTAAVQAPVVAPQPTAAVQTPVVAVKGAKSRSLEDIIASCNEDIARENAAANAARAAIQPPPPENKPVIKSQTVDAPIAQVQNVVKSAVVSAVAEIKKEPVKALVAQPTIDPKVLEEAARIGAAGESDYISRVTNKSISSKEDLSKIFNNAMGMEFADRSKYISDATSGSITSNEDLASALRDASNLGENIKKGYIDSATNTSTAKSEPVVSAVAETQKLFASTNQKNVDERLQKMLEEASIGMPNGTVKKLEDFSKEAQEMMKFVASKVNDSQEAAMLEYNMTKNGVMTREERGVSTDDFYKLYPDAPRQSADDWTPGAHPIIAGLQAAYDTALYPAKVALNNYDTGKMGPEISTKDIIEKYDAYQAKIAVPAPAQLVAPTPVVSGVGNSPIPVGGPGFRAEELSAEDAREFLDLLESSEKSVGVQQNANSYLKRIVDLLSAQPESSIPGSAGTLNSIQPIYNSQAPPKWSLQSYAGVSNGISEIGSAFAQLNP